MDSLQLQHFSQFLNDSSREDVKIIALRELLGLTGNEKVCSLVEDSDIPKLLVNCLLDKNDTIRKSACLSLINISASESGAFKLMDSCCDEIMTRLMNQIMDPDSCAADGACMALSNLTRHSETARLFVDMNVDIDKLINAFTKLNYNSKGCNLHYLGPVFSNLSQVLEFRKKLMTKTKCRIQKLLPFTQFQASSVRRSGIVGAIRNCCFDTSFHDWLLGSDVDILPHLLLPLAGPEEFSEEENDKLPLDLQYLGKDKERESDHEIRKMLLEAIHQLCATRAGREILREKNTYVILREFHKWEKNKSVVLACENIVDILIRTEEEIKEDNLKDLVVPESYVSKFEEMDNQYLRDEW